MDTKLNESFKREEQDRRIKSPLEANSMFSQWEKDHSQRSAVYSQVRNQMEGGRPIDPNELRKKGMQWQSNINFGDAQADRDRVLIPLWKAVHGAPHAISVSIDSGSTDSGKWQAAFEEAFDEFKEDCGQSYTIQFMRSMKNLVDFGCGAVMWDNMNTPMYRALNFQRIYFPKNTRMDMKTWEAVGIVDDISASELWAKIRNPEVSSKSKQVGWSEDAIKAAIVSACGEAWDGQDFTRFQDMLVNNDLAVSSKFQPLAIRIIYIKGFDGKIAKYIFTQNNNGGTEFLYKNEKEADDFGDIFGFVWYDTGVDSMVHSIKGFGVKNYAPALLKNRMRCRIVDGAGIAMSLNFKKSGEMPSESPPVESYGTINVFPEQLEQISTYPQFAQGLQVLEMLEANQAQNNSLYRQQQKQVADSQTATQATILAQMQGEVTEASMALILTQIGESYFAQMVKRLRKKGNTDSYAKDFVRRLRNKGVPDEVIFGNEVAVRVRCGTTAGMANPILRGQTILEVAGYLANKPEVNQRWIDEQFIANKLGSQAVNKALLPVDSESNPAARRMAKLENLAFGQGEEFDAAPSDAHVEHIDIHLRPVETAVDRLNQGAEYDAQSIGPHIIAVEHSGQHLTFLSKDETKKPLFIQMKARLTAVQSALRGVMANLQKQQQAMQEQQAQAQMNAQQETQMMQQPQEEMQPMQ